MRALKRWWKKIKSEQRIASKRNALAEELRAHLGLQIPPRLVPSGSQGHDSTYIIEGAGKKWGVLRLANPHKERAPPDPSMPFTLEETPARINHEWNCYRRGAPFNLTPKPLWRSEDALVCSYFPYQSLHKKIMKNPKEAWNILIKATEALQKLHAAGITHMDASLANILADEKMEHLVFIDFEYAPSPKISPVQQRIYDHLRLLESTWKFIPPSLRSKNKDWLKLAAGCFDDDMKQANITPLVPALSRILYAPEIDIKGVLFQKTP